MLEVPFGFGLLLEKFGTLRGRVKHTAAEGDTGVTAAVSIVRCAEAWPFPTGLGRAPGRSWSNGLSTPKSVLCSTERC